MSGQITLNVEQQEYTFQISQPGLYPYSLNHLDPQAVAGVWPYQPLRVEQNLEVDRVYLSGLRFRLTPTSWINVRWGVFLTPYYHCRICNSLYTPTDVTTCDETPVMTQWHLCFICASWELESRKKDGLVIDGHKYLLGNGNWGGMGGRRFVIETLDGQRIETCDLWHKGKIPEFFRPLFPDTARFVEGAKLIQHPDGSASWEASH